MAVAPGVHTHGAMMFNRAYVPFPTGMTNTLDSKVCAKHAGLAGGLGCGAGLPHGMLALVWDCPNCKVDGYRLYRVDGTRHEAVAIPANGADFTAALLDAPPGGFGSRCYAAVAYRGQNESDLSNAYCTGAGSVMKMGTLNLQAQHVRSARMGREKSALSATHNDAIASKTSLEVGAMHFEHAAPAGDTWQNIISRGAVDFDLASWSPQNHLVSAKLHVSAQTSTLDNGTSDHSTSCASAIGEGGSRWWEFGDWIFTAGQKSDAPLDTSGARLQPGDVDGPDAVYDVTPIVADWIKGVPNFGFVLMTDDTGIDAFTNNACMTTYEGPITLELTYWN